MRQHVDNARSYINRLGQIAARPNPLSNVDYIDLLIQSEEQEHKVGWEGRVRYLRGLRELAITGDEIARGGDPTTTAFRR
jgi:hypothetical protein